MTLSTFLAWKKKKLKEKELALKKLNEKKKSDFKSGKEGGVRVASRAGSDWQGGRGESG